MRIILAARRLLALGSLARRAGLALGDVVVVVGVGVGGASWWCGALVGLGAACLAVGLQNVLTLGRLVGDRKLLL